MTTDRDAGFGVSYIRSSEYLAWSQLNGIKISLVELSILKMLDFEYVKRHSKPIEDEMKVVSDQPLSPALFDSIF